jgi:hypothetical protein
VISALEQILARAAETVWLPVLWAGASASVGWCAAIHLPMVAVYVAGAARSRRHALVLTVFLTLGLMGGIVLLGMTANPLGQDAPSILHVSKYPFWGLGLGLLAAGILLSGLIAPRLLPGGLQTLGDYLTRVGPLGALLLGAALGLLQTPACPSCRAALLAFLENTVVEGPSSNGFALLVSFAAGQSLMVFAVGVLMSVVRSDLFATLRTRMCSAEPRAQLLAGNMLMVLGIYFIIVG